MSIDAQVVESCCGELLDSGDVHCRKIHFANAVVVRICDVKDVAW